MSYPNRALLVQQDRRLVEALDELERQIKSVASQTDASPTNVTIPPPNIGSLTVIAANGVFDAVIFDESPVTRGITYFLEYSTSVNFSQPHVITLGATRNWRGFLGNLTLYWRAYSQYRQSAPSATVYFGAPTAVVGGGAAGPTLQPSAGSGTAPSAGTLGGSGFGREPIRGRGVQNA